MPRRSHSSPPSGCAAAWAVLWSLVWIASSLGPIGRALGEAPSADPSDPHAAARLLVITRCSACHAADEAESGLRLDSRAGLLAGGDFGPAVVVGDGQASELVRRIRSTADDERMPPDGDPLSPAEIEAIIRWIDAGAPWPDSHDTTAADTRDARLDHWAWQPIAPQMVPDTTGLFDGLAGVEPARNGIDHFIRARLHVEGLAPSPVAERPTLIRRLSFDLIGLPPTPEEIDAFVNDTAPDAYEQLVERLLASPRYGERWARHWLDVVHYGDTHGYDKDKPRPNAWPYRDYVIRSLNADKPYARFVEEQIAGDVLYSDTRDGHEALGFIAAGPWDFIGHREVPETKTDGKIARHLDRDDMVATTIGTFASVTVHCAQCHAHKFDPVSQEDYYALQAVFAAIDRDDRRFDADPEVAARRRELTDLKERHAAAKRTLEAAVAEAAGPRLTEIDAALAALPAGDANPGPAYGWHSDISPTPDSEKWVQVDLGAARRMDEIVLRPCHDTFNGIGDGFGFPRQYRVEVSDDASFSEGVREVFTTGDEDVANPGVSPQRHAAAVTARYVRVTATRLAERQNDFIFALAELEAIGEAAAGETSANLARAAEVSSLDSIEALPRWGRANLVDGESPSDVGGERQLLEDERAALLSHHTTAEQSAGIAAAEAGIREAEAALAGLPEQAAVYAAGSFVRGGEPRPIHLLSRGNVLAPTREVGPGSLSLIEGLVSRFDLPADHAEGDRRTALAKWLTDPANPLLWRSIVNRVWLYHFGRGLVDTPDDFGRMGGAPSHPALLDWLAAGFRDGGGSIKDLHRAIVNSATYRQVSITRAEAAAIDADNRWLWRQSRQRLEAEAIRDAVLSTAGTLDLSMGGPGWQDFVIEHPEHSPHYRYDLADPADPATWRRSVYRFVVRSQTQPFMTCLDCADPSMRVGKRNESISALQALALLNNGFMLVQSERFAERVAREAGESIEAQVTRAFRLALGREPDDVERQALVELTEAHGLANTCRMIFNLNEFAYVD
jgi:mono/diheme cytochrome c family protein